MHIERHASRAAFILVASNIAVNNNANNKIFEKIQKNIIVMLKYRKQIYILYFCCK